jgi:hypothetical protein
MTVFLMLSCVLYRSLNFRLADFSSLVHIVLRLPCTGGISSSIRQSKKLGYVCFRFGGAVRRIAKHVARVEAPTWFRAAGTARWDLKRPAI